MPKQLMHHDTLQNARKAARDKYRALVFIFDYEPTPAKEAKLIALIKRRTTLHCDAVAEVGDGNRRTGKYWVPS